MDAGPAFAADKPNILLIVADDHGYSDIGVYGGGEAADTHAQSGSHGGRRHGLLLVLRPAELYPSRAIQTGRIPNRSGMTTVAFQGQGGGLPAAGGPGLGAEKAGYHTYFTGKWHLGEADYALPMPGLRCDGACVSSITSMPTPTAIPSGSRTWIRSCGPCSTR
ncbi:MAG: sulfatase-like hydrolase/transferase [Pseudomonadales bacterium]|nr:sulfatase-like hydrolase/transferase [Pseudomonadales bacterium]